MKQKISIVIPLHNEEENLRELEENIRNMLDSSGICGEIILVDDNSCDSTPKICDELAKKENIRTLHRRGNPGMGNALKDGTGKAENNIIVWIMGDLSDDLSAVPRFAEKIQGGCDMVIGSRYMKGGAAEIILWKRIASNGFTSLARIFLGVKVHDITNSFRAFRKEVFDSISLESGDFGISPEFALKAHNKGYKLCEVSAFHRDRVKGTAKFRMFKMGRRYFLIFLKAVFSKYLGKSL